MTASNRNRPPGREDVRTAVQTACGAHDPAVTGRWSAEVRTDDGALDSLRGEWESLYARCPAATPFQSWGWLAAWWRSYGVPGALRLVLVRHAGELVAALPLMVRRRYGHRVLVPLGEEISDHVDVLADERYADRALRLAAAELFRRQGRSRSARRGGWAAIDLSDVRPGACAHRLRDWWPRPQVSLPSSPCLQRRALPAEEYLRTLPANRRRKTRRALRRAAAAGLRPRTVPADGVRGAVETLLRLHRRQWDGRGGNPEHLRPRYARHLIDALSVMVPAGQAAMTTYVLDAAEENDEPGGENDEPGGEEVCVVVNLIGHDLVGGYLYGIEPEARRRVDFLPIFIAFLLDLAVARGKPLASMLRGAEEHKEHWRFDLVRNERLLLGGADRLTALSYMSVVRARAGAAALVKERLPRLYPLLSKVRRPGSRVRGGPDR